MTHTEPALQPQPAPASHHREYFARRRRRYVKELGGPSHLSNQEHTTVKPGTLLSSFLVLVIRSYHSSVPMLVPQTACPRPYRLDHRLAEILLSVIQITVLNNQAAKVDTPGVTILACVEGDIGCDDPPSNPRRTLAIDTLHLLGDGAQRLRGVSHHLAAGDLVGSELDLD